MKGETWILRATARFHSALRADSHSNSERVLQRLRKIRKLPNVIPQAGETQLRLLVPTLLSSPKLGPSNQYYTIGKTEAQVSDLSLLCPQEQSLCFHLGSDVFPELDCVSSGCWEVLLR